MKWTLFNGVKDTNKTDREGAWEDLVREVKTAGAVSMKTNMTMIKLAAFGSERGGGASLRNTDNIERFFGVEADYDAGEVSMADARDRLDSAGIKCLLHSTSQSTPETPRWRVLAPFFDPEGEVLEVRKNALNRINGVLGGILAPESWTPAQAYFIGSLSGQPPQEVIETGDLCGYIDAMSHLDEIAIGAGERRKPTLASGGSQRATTPAPDPGHRLAQGEGRREMLKSYGGSLRADGADAEQIYTAFQRFAKMHFDDGHIDWKNIKELAQWCGSKSTREELVLASFDAPEASEASGSEPVVRQQRDRAEADWDDYVFVQQENKVMRLTTGAMSTVPAFNSAMLGEDRRVPAANNKTKEVSAMAYLLDYKRIAPVFYRMYMPGVGKFFTHQGEACVNSYMPELVPEACENWADGDAWKIVEAHFKALFDDPTHGDMILDWMAHNVAHPGKKILWAPVIKGTQGDGKSTIRNILTLVMGYQNVRDITHSDLNSAFNAYAEGACVGALEEIRVTGHSRFDTMNALKPLITNQIVSVIRKGQDSIQAPNTMNYIGFTNEDDALPIDGNDRRYAIFYTKYDNREALLKDRDDAYWEALHGAYRNNVGAIRGWLLSRDLSAFNTVVAPDTGDNKARMIANSMSKAQKTEAGIIDLFYEIGDIHDARMLTKEIGRYNYKQTYHEVLNLLRKANYTRMRFKVHNQNRRLWIRQSVPELMADGDYRRHLAEQIFPDEPWVGP